MSEVRKDPTFFFGRHALLLWLQERLAEESSHRPIVLQGGDGIGKTAVLQQIKAGRMGTEYVVAYVDLAETNPDSMSQLLWELARIFAPQVAGGEVSEKLHRSDFVADPEKAFETAVLQPEGGQLDNHHLILLFDNFHTLQRHFAGGGLPYRAFDHWQRQLQDVPNLHTIFTISNGDGDRFALFDRAHRYHIEPMVSSASSDLVRALSSYTFYSDVAQYIGDASGGNPRTITRVMAALKESRQDNPRWQPTVADVAALRVLAPETAVSHRPTYEFANPKATTAADNTGKRTLRYAGAMVGVALIILLLWAIFQPYQRDQLTTETGMMVGLITPTPTKTPLPVIDYAATPRVTRVTVTPVPPTSTPTQTPTAVPTITPTTPPTSTPSPTSISRSIIRDSDGMEMLLIPAGTFTMGGRENDYAASPDERPLHMVQLDDFYMDKYEVNLEQYAAFINQQEGNGGLCDKSGNCVLARQDSLFSFLDKQDMGDGTIQYFPLSGYANYPVNNISWNGAAAYCEYVNGRLPTEAEWEYAARGEDGRLYPWGDEFPNETRAIFNSESFDSLVPVDGLPDGASAFGIYGMAGSMWEWTADWYDERYYLESPLLNPQGPSRGLTKVTRGGAWPFNNQADRIRSSNRSGLSPEQLHSIVGFRCVQEME